MRRTPSTVTISLLIAGAMCMPAFAWDGNRPGPGGKGGAPRTARPGVRLRGPITDALQKLDRMTPEQRDHALDELPPERRHKLEQGLEEYDNLSADDRKRLAQRYEWFSGLSAGRQDALRKVFQKFTTLPPERRDALRDEMTRLSGLSESDRKARLKSRDFKSKYSRLEREIIEDLCAALPD
jgi:hypothetical protein